MNTTREETQRWVADLVAISILTVLTAGAVLFPATPDPVIWLLGIPFLLLYPGYAAIAALFPERGVKTPPTAIRPQEPPNGVARLGMAIVLSPVLVAAVGIGLSAFEAIRLVPIVLGLTTVTVGFSLIAILRRAQLPGHLRAGLPALSSQTIGVLSGTTGQNVFLLLSIVALLGVSIAAVAIPPDGEAHTEVYLLSEDEDGELVANGFPTNMTAGETEQLTIGLENHENERMTYELHTVLQELSGTEVVRQESLDRFQADIGDGGNVTTQRELTPSLTGELRLQVLVYEDGAPDEPHQESADNVLQLWVTVNEEP